MVARSIRRAGAVTEWFGTTSALTGHKLETTKRILEVYMPRTQKMASRGVVARIRAGAKQDDGDKRNEAG